MVCVYVFIDYIIGIPLGSIGVKYMESLYVKHLALIQFTLIEVNSI